jgi:hypothetical protein
MKKGFYRIVLGGILLMSTQLFALDDICQLGHETHLLTSEQSDKFYATRINGNRLEGKGLVKNIWHSGVSKPYVVAVDCGNDIIVNVATPSDVSILKTGQSVTFEGTCISYGMRRYIYSQKTYMVFDFEKGLVK